MAGYSFGQADIVRRAMSKKKETVLAAERTSFLHGDESRNIPGCIANGISEHAANKLFDEMSDFAKYAFNRSHAACYAVVAYQTAYLKYHFPKEYMKAVLNNTAFEKVPGLVSDLRIMSIEIEPPHVNKSALRFSIQDEKILFGLSSIKGLGESVTEVIKEREKNGPYQSIQEFIIRTRAEKKILENMTNAGAFDVFYPNRAAINDTIPEWLKLVKKLKDYDKKLIEAYDKKKIQGYQKKIQSLLDEIYRLEPSKVICEDELTKLVKEKDAIGTFATKHPLTLFKKPEQYNASPIVSIQSMNARQKVSAIGMISNFNIRHRKSDGAEMSFFDLSDLTGKIEICCFVEAFATYKKLIDDDGIVKINGTILENRDDPSIKQISVESVEEIHPHKDTIIIYVEGVHTLEEGLWNVIKPYVAQNGNPVKIHDLLFNEYRDCDLLLSPAITENPNINAKIKDLG